MLHWIKVRVRKIEKQKIRSPPSQSGRSGTGKYWDGACTEAHTSRRHPLRTRSPCYGGSPRPINPGSWRSLCHQGKYELFMCSIIPFIRCLGARTTLYVWPTKKWPNIFGPNWAVLLLGSSSMELSTYVEWFNGMSRIATERGRCTWPRDRARRVFSLLSSSPAASAPCFVPSWNFAS